MTVKVEIKHMCFKFQARQSIVFKHPHTRFPTLDKNPVYPCPNANIHPTYGIYLTRMLAVQKSINNKSNR
jgi:hypothetical protein